jgi:preprotein translocase subunit SecY
MLFQDKRYRLSTVVICLIKSILLLRRLFVKEEEILGRRISYIVFVVVEMLVGSVLNELLSEK